MKIERLMAEELPSESSALLQSRTLLGSPPFLRLWENVGGRVVVWVMEENGGIVAMLPGLEFRGKPFSRFQAGPDGLYLRIIRPDNRKTMLDSQEMLLAAMLKYGYARVYLSDYFRELGEMVRMSVEMQSTHLIELTEGWEPPDGTLRSEIRKAEREGVTVSEFDSTNEMSGFLALMKGTERRHGRAQKYPDAFFGALADLAAQDDRVRWYYVNQGGEPVASHIYFIENDTSLNWQIYFDKNYSSLKANQLMTYTAARELHKEGVRFLNMGATPPDAEGVKVYKEKWGGRSVAYPCFVQKSMLGRIF